MAATKRPSNSAAKKAIPAKKTHRAWWWCLGIVAALVVLAVALLALCFSPLRSLPLAPLTDRHYLLISRITNQLSREVMRRTPRAEAELRLSVDDVNTFLEFARHTAYAGGADVPPPESFMLGYRPDGAFTFVVPAQAAPRWCFGGNVYLSGRLHLEKQDDQLFVDVPELRFGRADMPVPGGGTHLREAGVEAVKKALSREFNDAVKSFYAERDGSIVIVYRPRRMRHLLPRLLKAL